jgi:hypothetical protein
VAASKHGDHQFFNNLRLAYNDLRYLGGDLFVGFIEPLHTLQVIFVEHIGSFNKKVI